MGIRSGVGGFVLVAAASSVVLSVMGSNPESARAQDAGTTEVVSATVTLSRGGFAGPTLTLRRNETATLTVSLRVRNADGLYGNAPTTAGEVILYREDGRLSSGPLETQPSAERVIAGFRRVSLSLVSGDSSYGTWAGRTQLIGAADSGRWRAKEILLGDLECQFTPSCWGPHELDFPWVPLDPAIATTAFADVDGSDWPQVTSLRVQRRPTDPGGAYKVVARARYSDTGLPVRGRQMDFSPHCLDNEDASIDYPRSGPYAGTSRRVTDRIGRAVLATSEVADTWCVWLGEDGYWNQVVRVAAAPHIRSSVSVRPARSRVLAGETIRVIGKVTPSSPSMGWRKVRLQRHSKGRWRTVNRTKTATSPSTGKFRTAATPPRGEWKYRVCVPAAGAVMRDCSKRFVLSAR